MFTLHVMTEMPSSHLRNIKGTHCGLAKRCVNVSPFLWTVSVIDLALRYTDKLRLFRWVLTMLPLLPIYVCFAKRFHVISIWGTAS